MSSQQEDYLDQLLKSMDKLEPPEEALLAPETDFAVPETVVAEESERPTIDYAEETVLPPERAGASAEPRDTDPAYADPAYADAAYTDPAHTDAAYTDSTYIDAASADATDTEPVYAETSHADSAPRMDFDETAELSGFAMEPIDTADTAFQMEDIQEDTESSKVQHRSEADDIRDYLRAMASEEEKTEDEADLSEEDIERLLQQNNAAHDKEDPGDTALDDDLMNLLDSFSSEDRNLEDIHSMLQKSDNNVALDESMFDNQDPAGDLMRQLESGDGEAAEEADEYAGMSERQIKALKKKKEREEKKAQKKAEKEAKKAAKRAKKNGGKDTDTPTGQETATEAGTARKAMAATEPVTAPEDAVFANLTPVEDAAEPGSAPEKEAIPYEGDEPIAMDMEDLDALLGIESFASDDAAEEIREIAPEEELELTEDELDKQLASKEEPTKKKNLFARIMDFLLEDDEEEEAARGTEDVPLSDENKAILEEMDQEGKNAEKKKKKGKKGKAEKNADADEGDEEADGGKAKPKKKEKKAPKPQKVKETEPVDPRNRITFKKLFPIILAGLSLFAVIFLLVNLGGEFTVKQSAKKAFYEEDYETCYQDLYGKKLNETEQIMFGKSESILRIRLWMREYEMFAEEGSEPEALDVLVQSVKDYAALYEYAQKWNADGDISVIYGQMLQILQQKYHLSEADALVIAAEKSDVEYTRMIYDIVAGKEVPGLQGESGAADLPDMLPEEKQFPENNGG